MKTIRAPFCGILWLVLLSAVVFPQKFETVRDGVEYARMTHRIKDEPVVINLLRVDLKKVRLDVVHAHNTALGLEKTSAIAARRGAVAAINAGFFRLDRSAFAGDPVGVLKIDGRLLSESFNSRTALGIINGKDRTEVVFGRLEASGAVAYSANGTKTFDGINRERRKNEVILYTPEFGRTPALEYRTTEIILRDCRPRCRRVEVVENTGGTLIPAGGYIVSVGETAEKEALVEFMKRHSGTKLPRRVSVLETLVVRGDTDQNVPNVRKMFQAAEDIVSGIPQLIKDGRVEITWEQERSSRAFVETRHPRTAVAKLKDGRFLLVTVDGRQPGVSVGMSLVELAEFLRELGAVEALNLDGGGSTTMFLDGRIVNQPSDKEGERRVSDAILVFPRKR